MADAFSILPGVEVPVGSIAKSLAELWEGTPGSGEAAPSEFRASQMNVVLHFGLSATDTDAQETFNVVVSFAERYPCRVVVLCPVREGSGSTALRAKIFSQCFIGQSRREMSCCEFILLSYPQESRKFLESQVSICLEGDLPTFYWPHRISEASRLSDYPYLLKTCHRIIIDTSIEAPDILSPLQPFREKVRDLVYARLLPVRQSLGQFFSGYAPANLVESLTALKLTFDASHETEARTLLDWVLGGLHRCGLPDQSAFQSSRSLSESPNTLSLQFDYDMAGRHFSWKADLGKGNAVFDADFGNGQMTLIAPSRLLELMPALGEAMFF